MVFEVATRLYFDQVFDFCETMSAQNARMSFTDIKTRQDLEKWFEDPLVTLYLALSDTGHVVGLLRTKRGQGLKSHAVMIAAAVSSDYRNMNIATDLTLFGLEDQKKKGVVLARTYIYSWNKASIATIKKCGFVQSGCVYMHQYEPDLQAYCDDLIFHKEL